MSEIHTIRNVTVIEHLMCFFYHDNTAKPLKKHEHQ